MITSDDLRTNHAHVVARIRGMGLARITTAQLAVLLSDPDTLEKHLRPALWHYMHSVDPAEFEADL